MTYTDVSLSVTLRVSHVDEITATRRWMPQIQPMHRSIAEADALCAKLCAGQYGLISTSQIYSCGLSRQALHRRTRSGRLIPVAGTVYRDPAAPQHELAPVMTALLVAGDGAIASHTTAAALRGLSGFRLEPVHVSMTRRLRSRPGIVVHQVDRFIDRERTSVGTLPTTSGRRTLLDLASINHPSLEKALDEMLRRRIVELSDVWSLVELPEMWRRKGTRRMIDLLHVRSHDHVPTDSALEDMFRKIVRKHRLPIPVQQHPVTISSGMIHLDFAYPQAAVAIECDGYAWHMDKAAFERDRVRDVEVQSRGWIVLRFTWSVLKWRDRFVAEKVRQHLAQRTQLRV
jgi:very-short-patch-repair endonuclease